MSQFSSRSDLQCDLEQVPSWSRMSDSLPWLSRRFYFLCLIAWEFSSFLGRTGSPSLMRPRPDTAVPPFRLRPHTIHPSLGVGELGGGSWHFWGTGIWDGLGSVQLCQEYGCCRKKAACDGSTRALGPADFPPFGTGWSKEFLMTGFENVSRLYIARACFR